MKLITVASGKHIDLDNLRMEDIDIKDIAHSLSNICRFGGSARFHYSVAQHSLYVAGQVASKHRLWALMHDAPEAYYGDVITPIKHDNRFSLMRDLFEKVDTIVYRRFGLISIEDRFSELPVEVREADDAVRMTETDQLMEGEPKVKSFKMAAIVIKKMEPKEAERRFITAWEHCYKKTKNMDAWYPSLSGYNHQGETEDE